MGRSIGIAGNKQDDEVSSTPVASIIGSSNSNPETSVTEHELCNREILATYTVR